MDATRVLLQIPIVNIVLRYKIPIARDVLADIMLTAQAYARQPLYQVLATALK